MMLGRRPDDGHVMPTKVDGRRCHESSRKALSCPPSSGAKKAIMRPPAHPPRSLKVPS